MPTRALFLLFLAGCAAPSFPDSPAGRGFAEGGGGWETANPGLGFHATFDAHGATVVGGEARFRIGGIGAGWRLGDCVEEAGGCVPRLERTDGVVTEWWVDRPDRLEHGFDVAEGGDALRIDIPVDGAGLRDVGDAVTLAVPGTLGYTYADLYVTDAAGRALPAELSVAGDAIRITVDTTDAVWPVHVDPSLTPATWIGAVASPDSFGDYVAHLGDVNGDGYGDLAVYGSTTGTIHVFHGTATGLSTTPATSITRSGARPTPAGDVDGDGYDDLLVSTTSNILVYYGAATGIATTGTTSVAPSGSSTINALGVGDTNGDGYDDVLVGRPYGTSGETNEGFAALYRGTSTGLGAIATWTWQSNQASAYAGSALAGGDLDGDGYADLAVGAPNYDDGSTDEGAVFVFFGGTGTISATPDVTMQPNVASARFGSALADLGDVDGDGDDELVVGSPGYSAGGVSGALFVQRGAASGPPATPDWTVSDRDHAGVGSVVSAGGDVDGDGVPDVVAGIPGASVASAADGAVLVWFGASTGFGTSADLVVGGGTNGSRLGTAVAAGGDVDGDGFGDVFAGAPGYYATSRTTEGRVLALYGRTGGPATWSTWSDTRTGTRADDYFGARITNLGDVNGDGYEDIAVCGSGAYSTYVYHGSAIGLDAVPATTLTVRTSYFGGGPYAHGDFDGDGYEDFLIGSSSWSNPTSGEGYAAVYDGSALGLGTSPSWSVESGQESAYLGGGVAAGDFDGDGDDDVAVGAEYYDFGHTNEGIVFVYDGSPTGISPSATWYWDADVANAHAGAELAAGDVNGDGYDDLFVGVTGWSDGESGEGAVALFLGSATGLASTPAWWAESDVVGAYLGVVMTVGDFDADGFADLAAGAPWLDDGERDEGAIYVFHGGVGGPSATPELVWTADTADARAGSVLDAADVDGDGFDDLLAGAPYFPDPAVYAGRAWVFRGGPGGLSADDPSWLSSYDSGSEFGAGVAGADVDGDGLAELLVGAMYAESSGYSSWLGRIYQWDLDDTDADGDFDVSDCDDADDGVHAGATELCDGVDNDCDGAIDEETPTWYADGDGDGYGDAGTATVTCTAPSGYVTDGTDCDDTSAAVSPGADETCNGRDDDCDGSADEAGEPGEPAWYADGDGDGFGDDRTRVYACTAPSGTVGTGGDCDDDDPSVADGADWYADADGDRFGDPATPTRACAAPAGYVSDARDCDDGDSAVSPSGVETCDGEDDDCDGTVDDGVTTTFHADIDGDGYGGTSITTAACSAPAGFVSNTDDCDDGDAAAHPGATETCDGADDDCDGAVDEGATATFYADIDGDGYGDVSRTTEACAAPGGYSVNAFDCDDTAATVHPGAAETCNAVDDDCDGRVDPDDATDAPGWYLDGDGDGYGDDATVVISCTRPDGTVDAGGDCDDADGTVSPGATEAWYDGVDQDCDGADDYDADGDGQRAEAHGGEDCDDTDATVYTGATDAARDCARRSEADADGDGHDDEASGGDDCDDTRDDVFPGATEVWYDGIDQDCDGNDGDQDDDGFALLYDCDDTDAAIRPGATEIADDGIDQDCDGEDETTEAGTCGCAQGGAPGSLLAVGVAIGLLGYRRRR